MGKLRYQGDVREVIPAVVGGRYRVIEKTYDPDDDETTIVVEPLIDPIKLLDK